MKSASPSLESLRTSAGLQLFAYRYPLMTAQAETFDPRNVRVPEGMSGGGTEITATTAVVVISFTILLAVVYTLLGKLKTEQRMLSGFREVIDSYKQAVTDANAQTKISQDGTAAQAKAFQSLLDTQATNSKLVIDAQAARIASLTEKLLQGNQYNDERVRTEVLATENRHHESLKHAHERITALERAISARDQLIDRLTRIMEKEGYMSPEQMASTLLPGAAAQPMAAPELRPI